MLTLLCYPRCTTCRKAQQWLDEQGIAYTYRDIKEEHPTAEELALWQKKSGLPVRKFFNTSGLLYKSMNLKEKLPGMSDEEMLQLLGSDGMLVKRPLVIGEVAVLVGFKEADWERCLKNG